MPGSHSTTANDASMAQSRERTTSEQHGFSVGAESVEHQQSPAEILPIGYPDRDIRAAIVVGRTGSISHQDAIPRRQLDAAP
jgi:hypothetical protein